MKKIKIIMLILLCVLCSTACGKHSNSNERTESNINNIKENIDISQLDSSKITYNYGKADMSVYNPSLEELSENAEIIFKGTLNKIDSYLDEGTMTIKSNYTFKVNEKYKGNIDSEIILNMVGGIMKYSDYIKKMQEYGNDVKETGDNDESYVAFGLEGFNPLCLNKEYVIYVKYNPDTAMYYPLFYFYGIYEKNEEGLYKRYGVDENDKQTIELDMIKSSIK